MELTCKFHVRIFVKFIICEYLEADETLVLFMCQLLLPCETLELAWMNLQCEKKINREAEKYRKKLNQT